MYYRWTITYGLPAGAAPAAAGAAAPGAEAAATAPPAGTEANFDKPKDRMDRKI